MDDFETFTRDKIARLRAEADALEKILKEFQGTKARLAGAQRRSGGDQPRGGAFGVVMSAINAAAGEGLNLDQMIAAAEAEGYEVKRATLRAQVWKAKEDGALTQIEPGRYRSSVYDDFAGINLDPPRNEWVDVLSGAPAGKPDPANSFSPPDDDEEIPF